MTPGAMTPMQGLDHPPAPAPPPPPGRRAARGRVGAALRAAALLAVAAAAVAGLFAAGMLPRARQEAELAAATRELRTAAPRVRVVSPSRLEGATELVLPGDATALQGTSIYARTRGYLHAFLVDIGDRVEAGQVLAEIDTPELDQEILEATATVRQAQAQEMLAVARLNLAKITRDRNLTLFRRDASTRQELDEADAALKVAEAAVEAARADVHAREASLHRLEELQSFQRVEAPFDGVITARNAEIGSLIAADGSIAGRELFRIVQTKTLRVFVHVPQLEAPGIRLGQQAELLVREFPDRAFVGTVARTAGEIDPASRTLLAEIHVDNADGALYSGMYVKVRFRFEHARHPVMVPATTLVVNAAGTRVAVVRDDGTIHYQPIEIGRDLGQDVEVLTGLAGGESLVVNPVESLTEGLRVEVLRNPPSPGAITRAAPPRPAPTRAETG